MRLASTLFLMVSISIFSGGIISSSAKINATCKSSSGFSIYDISIDTEINSTGEIRYRFAEQDIFYSATVITKENNILMGIAEFLESRSGETKARPWIFTFDLENKILTDNDNIKAKCK